MADIQCNPSNLFYGTVAQGNSVTLLLSITNIDDTISANVFTITIDNAKFALGVPLPPFTIAPQQTEIIQVIYTAGTPGHDTGTLTINSDADQNPYLIGLDGTSIASGKGISVSPSGNIFPNTKVGVASAAVAFVVSNPGNASTTVQIPVVASPFASADLPGSPTVLAPAGTFTFHVTFTPSGTGYVVNSSGISITSDAPSSPTLIDLEGLGVAIVPYASVIGGVENGYAAIGPLLRQFQATNFNCEETPFAVKLFSLQGPGYMAKLMRMEFQYEDNGVASLGILVTNELGQSTAQTVSIGTVAATGAVKNTLVDLAVTGELLELSVFPIGPVVIDAYTLRYIDGGEVTK